MTAEPPGPLPFQWEANDGPITPRRPEDDVESALPLSRQALTFVSGLVRAHRREIGSNWRALDPGQQALLVLV